MISPKVIIYVFLIIMSFKQEWGSGKKTSIKPAKMITHQNNSHIAVKECECIFALKKLQKCLLDEKDSQKAGLWFPVGESYCPKAGFNFQSIECPLAPKSKSVFIIPNSL